MLVKFRSIFSIRSRFVDLKFQQKVANCITANGAYFGAVDGEQKICAIFSFFNANEILAGFNENSRKYIARLIVCLQPLFRRWIVRL